MNGEYEFGVFYCIQRNDMKEGDSIWSIWYRRYHCFEGENHIALFERSLGCFPFSLQFLPLLG